MPVADYLARIASQGGVTVTVSSNVTPRVVVYDARSTEPTLLDLLGIKTHIVARTSDGRILAEYGVPVAPDYVLAALLITGLFLAVTVVGGTVVRLLKI